MLETALLVGGPGRIGVTRREGRGAAGATTGRRVAARNRGALAHACTGVARCNYRGMVTVGVAKEAL